MAIYPLELDGVKYFGNTIPEEKGKLSREEMRIQLNNQEIYAAWVKSEDERLQENAPDPIDETLDLLEQVGARASALVVATRETQDARRNLAVALLSAGKDSQEVFNASGVPAPSTVKQWAEKAKLSKKILDGLAKVKPRKELEDAEN